MKHLDHALGIDSVSERCRVQGLQFDAPVMGGDASIVHVFVVFVCRVDESANLENLERYTPLPLPPVDALDQTDAKTVAVVREEEVQGSPRLSHPSLC